MFREMSSKQNIIYVMSQKPVIDIRGYTSVVDGELPQSRLHPVEAGGLPDIVDDEVRGAGGGSSLVALQLYSNIFSEIIRNLNHVTYSGPGLLKVSQIPRQNKFSTLLVKKYVKRILYLMHKSPKKRKIKQAFYQQIKNQFNATFNVII